MCRLASGAAGQALPNREATASTMLPRARAPRLVRAPARALLNAPAPAACRPPNPRGVANFEHYLGGQDYHVPFDVMSRLYKDPTALHVVEDERLRHMARAMIEQVGRERWGARGCALGVWGASWQLVWWLSWAVALPSGPRTCTARRPCMSCAHHPTNHRSPAQAVDDRYLELYQQCTTMARELANTNLVGGTRCWGRGREPVCGGGSLSTIKRLPLQLRAPASRCPCLLRKSHRLSFPQPPRARTWLHAQTSKLPIPVPGAGAVSGVAGVVK